MGGAVGHSLFHMPWSSQGPLLSWSIHPEGAGPSPVWYLSACSGPSLTVKQQDREAESTGVGKVKDAWENKGKRQRALLRECWGSGGGGAPLVTSIPAFIPPLSSPLTPHLCLCVLKLHYLSQHL